MTPDGKPDELFMKRFPKVSTLVLMRDPRSIIFSQLHTYEFTHLRPDSLASVAREIAGQKVELKGGSEATKAIVHQAYEVIFGRCCSSQQSLRDLAAALGQQRQPVGLVRYEEVLVDPARTLARVFGLAMLPWRAGQTMGWIARLRAAACKRGRSAYKVCLSEPPGQVCDPPITMLGGWFWDIELVSA